jgi:hypothetical protein
MANLKLGLLQCAMSDADAVLLPDLSLTPRLTVMSSQLVVDKVRRLLPGLPGLRGLLG